MLAALAVSAVSSALVVVPVPAIGQNPFGSVSGASTTNVVGSYVVTLLAAVAMLPVLVLGTVSILLDSAPLGWATLVAAVLWGGALLVTGIEVGGRQLDRRGPLLLARLARFHGS
jgi:ABC-2 type transport system permease protein